MNNNIKTISMLINNLVQIKVPSPGFRQWPFIGLEELRARVSNDDRAARAVFLLTFCLQTEDEVTSKETTVKNRRGFMSSHALPSTGIASQVMASFEALLLSGEETESAFEKAWAGDLNVPSDKDGKPLAILKADGARFATSKDGMVAYATLVGTRYSKATLIVVRDQLMAADPALRAAARVISPEI